MFQDWIWQDVVNVFVQVVFILSVIPMILQKVKPPLTTSIPTTIAVAVFVATSSSLNLWLTSFFMAINGIQWAILAWQRWRIDGFKSMRWILLKGQGNV